MIDLSNLTESEQRQFADNKSVLTNTGKRVCLYMRFSSERQTEQSIEGQLRDNIAYCARNNYRIVAVYVDRATSAAKRVDKRVHFQQMIRDSARHQWEAVIVWKLDRFARSREDSVSYKVRLKKNGVKVESSTEAISDNPESIILEAVLEGIAEYYSADLSQKITRGMRESANKLQSLGGIIPLGYKSVNKKLEIDEATAPYVQEIFQRYADGERIADIANSLNARGVRTALGRPFTKSSFKTFWKNERYIGTFVYKDIRIENSVPAIIDKEVFEACRARAESAARTPARYKAKETYLLTGKLFCGHCGANMEGDSGTSKHGRTYRYYTCHSRKKNRSCDKKPVRKDWIEKVVLDEALSLLTDENIEKLADLAMLEVDNEIAVSRIPALEEKLAEVRRGIVNISKALESGSTSKTLIARLDALEEQEEQLEEEIKNEGMLVYSIDRYHIIYWLEKFKQCAIKDENYQRVIIDCLVNSVTVWDEADGFRISFAFNLSYNTDRTLRFNADGEPCLDVDMFGYGEVRCTRPRISEHRIVFGTICVVTKIHHLP